MAGTTNVKGLILVHVYTGHRQPSMAGTTNVKGLILVHVYTGHRQPSMAGTTNVKGLILVHVYTGHSQPSMAGTTNVKGLILVHVYTGHRQPSKAGKSCFSCPSEPLPRLCANHHHFTFPAPQSVLPTPPGAHYRNSLGVFSYTSSSKN